MHGTGSIQTGFRSALAPARPFVNWRGFGGLWLLFHSWPLHGEREIALCCLVCFVRKRDTSTCRRTPEVFGYRDLPRGCGSRGSPKNLRFAFIPSTNAGMSLSRHLGLETSFLRWWPRCVL